MAKALLVFIFCTKYIESRSLEWFFNPYQTGIKNNEVIINHVKLFNDHGEHLKDKYKDSERSLRGRSLDNQLTPNFTKLSRSLSLRFQPFESLARNINFQAPSNTFCKSLIIVVIPYDNI